ncbi:hypothetical protein MRB53_005451 [Persea americana]|uniref:Uncharacterized protein n=1 Tax=Persea americana TaxID=3435 RepID=A0ACC2MDJ8_PERAE|nr:hypothetical protein MRB53_005451 [Persea americana]
MQQEMKKDGNPSFVRKVQVPLLLVPFMDGSALSADDDCDDFCFASSSSSGCFGEDREGFFSSSCSQTGRERRKKSCRGNRDLTAVPVFHSLESLQKEANIKMG